MGDEKKIRCVLILGMHRSGTSCLAGSLQKRGLFLGQVHESNPHNKKGNRENQKIVDLNNEILQFNSGEWNMPPSDKLHWNDSHLLSFRQILSEFADSTSSLWGFKDPRTLLTLDFWKSNLGKCEYIAAVRHPVAVAKSLQSRDGIKLEQGIDLWWTYNRRLLEELKDSPFPVVSFDQAQKKYFQNVEKLASKLGLCSLEGGLDDFYDDKLINYRQTGAYELPRTIRTVYEEILEYAV